MINQFKEMLVKTGIAVHIVDAPIIALGNNLDSFVVKMSSFVAPSLESLVEDLRMRDTLIVFLYQVEEAEHPMGKVLVRMGWIDNFKGAK